MKGRKTFSNQAKGTEQNIIEDAETSPEKDGDAGEANVKQTGEDEHTVAYVGLETISRQISDLKNEMKSDLRSFKEEFKNNMKQEFAQFKQEIHDKLSSNTNEIQKQQSRLTEAEKRIEHLETWSIEVNAALLKTLRKNREIQEIHVEITFESTESLRARRMTVRSLNLWRGFSRRS